MNLYATIDDLKNRLNFDAIEIPGVDIDALCFDALNVASRDIEAPECANRVFWTGVATKYFDGPEVDATLHDGRGESEWMHVDDLLAVDEILEDADGDGIYETEWELGVDYLLSPANKWPKTRLEVTRAGTKRFAAGKRRFKITGTFGYGDGTGPNPWVSALVTGTVGTTNGTTLTLSGAGLKSGMTIKLGSEQMYVRSVTDEGATHTALVDRAVNGSTAATHASVSVNVARYPVDVKRTCLYLAVEDINTMGAAGLSGESLMGDYRKTASRVSANDKRRLVGIHRRGVI